MLTYVGGVDEVGVGALAGPIVAVAVILPVDMEIRRLSEVPMLKSWWPLQGVADSKTTTEAFREEFQPVLCEFLQDAGGGVGVCSTSVEYLNAHGHKRALDVTLQEAVRKAVEDVGGHRPDYLIVDGSTGVNGYPGPQRIEPKADQNYFVVAAASILAKLYRDGEMRRLDLEYPQYGWGQSKGYPTKVHKHALQQHGLTPHHRVKACGTVAKKSPPVRKPAGW